MGEELTEVLYNKYRPTKWSEIVGHKAQVDALRQVLKDKGAQTFMFTGPAGVGKTTLARLAAKEFGADDLIEIDGATFNGVDDMRRVQESLVYQPFGGGKRAILIDEAHRLSGNAWDSLLKATEEPPEHVAWFFCTTNPAKMPKTLKTRCFPVTLGDVDDRDLEQLIDEVCEAEGVNLDSDFRGLVVHHAQGSPRQALVNLSAVWSAKNYSHASELLRVAVASSDAVIALCQDMLKGVTFTTAVAHVNEIKDTDAEGVRIVVTRYFSKVLMKGQSDKTYVFCLNVLEAFSQPYNQSDGLAPLLMSIGKVYFS